MQLRKLFAAVTLSAFFALGAPAQTTPGAGAKPAPAPAKKSGTTSKKKKKGGTATPAPAPAPTPPPAAPGVDEETRKALESMAPVTTPTVPVAAPVTPAEAAGPADDDPPVLKHTPFAGVVKKAKPFTLTANATDPSGVWGPIVYIRKKGMASSEYIPIRMVAAKGGQAGDFSLEIPAGLTNVTEGLEYYLEVWDNAGNGPVRAGAPETPFPVKVEEEKKTIVVAPPPPPPVKQKGAPPAIAHTAVVQATKGQSIEINARLVGDTGVSEAKVMFRHAGEHDYKALPMGNVGGDDYTATVPAAQANKDIEYYLEVFDKYGNGPGRSGAPNIPYVIKVLEPAVGPVTGAGAAVATGPKIVKAPFKPNPGRAAGWLAMAGFVGGLVFAGGEAYGAWSANNAYQHTFTFEGRLRPDLLDRANNYGNRAKTAAIVSGIGLAVGITLLVLFPEHPETMVIGGSGGDIGVRF